MKIDSIRNTAAVKPEAVFFINFFDCILRFYKVFRNLPFF